MPKSFARVLKVLPFLKGFAVSYLLQKLMNFVLYVQYLRQYNTQDAMHDLEEQADVFIHTT